MGRQMFIVILIKKVTDFFNFTGPQVGLFVYAIIWIVLISGRILIPKLLERGIQPKYIAIPFALIFIDSPLQAYHELLRGDGGLLRTPLGLFYPLLCYLWVVDIVNMLRRLIEDDLKKARTSHWKVMRKGIHYSLIFVMRQPNLQQARQVA